MPRKRIPSYRLHKSSGRAVVTLDGRDHWLGPYNSPESREKYNRVIAEWLSNGRRSSSTPAQVASLSVMELMAQFYDHVQAFYVRPDGSQTSEVSNFRDALKPLKALYGTTPAASFGPKGLAAVRQAMVDKGWCRSNVNKQVNRLRMMFKWGASMELVPASVYGSLATLAGLRKGNTDARESDPVRPVPDADVDAIRPHVARQVWTMIELQRLTGMRPGEAVTMRTCDLDRTGTVWTYTPQTHKNSHRGQARSIFVGPRAQAILGPWLRPNLSEYLFQPLEAERERRERMRAARVTPLSYGNGPGTNRVRRPEWKPSDRYDVCAYRAAIVRGCERAFVMPVELRKAPKGETAEQRAERHAKATE